MSDYFVGGADRANTRSAPHYIVIVDQAAIQKGLPAIHVHNLDLDVRTNATEVELTGARIVQSDERQDGARVWIESVDINVVH